MPCPHGCGELCVLQHPERVNAALAVVTKGLTEALANQRYPTLEECEAAGRGEYRLPDTPEEHARFEAYLRTRMGSDAHLNWYTLWFSYTIWRDRGGLPTQRKDE